MNWIEISIKTTTEAVEAVSNILYDAGVSGVVIEDPKDFVFEENNELLWDYVDESILPTSYEGAIVKGYLPASSDLPDKLELIQELVKGLPEFGLDVGLGEVTTLEVYEEEWSSAWKQYYKPTRIGKRLLVKPSWETCEPEPEDIVIDLDPGMAFGTGTHETTMMCMEALEAIVTSDSSVYDIGCGSGILSITAAKLGAKRVVAVDLDPVAVEVSEKNVAENQVDHLVSVRQGNLTEVLEGPAQIVVANIIADVVILLAREIQPFLAAGGHLIASGIILDKVDSVTTAFAENNLEVLKVNRMGEWAAVVAVKQGA